MKKLPIYFFSEDTNYSIKHKTHIRNWINNTIIKEGYTLHTLNFIFCSDDYLLNINQQYLNHNTYTDIITFDNSDVKGEIQGDVFISINRIFENAKKFNVSKSEELHRVIIHGTLHLLGYKDKSKADKQKMTEKENESLHLRAF